MSQINSHRIHVFTEYSIHFVQTPLRTYFFFTKANKQKIKQVSIAASPCINIGSSMLRSKVISKKQQ